MTTMQNMKTIRMTTLALLCAQCTVGESVQVEGATGSAVRVEEDGNRRIITADLEVLGGEVAQQLAQDVSFRAQVVNAIAPLVEASINELEPRVRDLEARVTALESQSPEQRLAALETTTESLRTDLEAESEARTTSESDLSSQIAALDTRMNAREGLGVPVAPGGVAFFNLEECPAGWREYVPARGRVVVGVNPDGVLEAEVGTALGDRENRPAGRHSHLAGVNPRSGTNEGNNTLVTSNLGVTASLGGVVLPGGSGVDGTNAPYVQLLACEKL